MQHVLEDSQAASTKKNTLKLDTEQTHGRAKAARVGAQNSFFSVTLFDEAVHFVIGADLLTRHTSNVLLRLSGDQDLSEAQTELWAFGPAILGQTCQHRQLNQKDERHAPEGDTICVINQVIFVFLTTSTAPLLPPLPLSNRRCTRPRGTDLPISTCNRPLLHSFLWDQLHHLLRLPRCHARRHWDSRHCFTKQSGPRSSGVNCTTSANSCFTIRSWARSRRASLKKCTTARLCRHRDTIKDN